MNKTMSFTKLLFTDCKNLLVELRKKSNLSKYKFRHKAKIELKYETEAYIARKINKIEILQSIELTFLCKFTISWLLNTYSFVSMYICIQDKKFVFQLLSWLEFSNLKKVSEQIWLSYFWNVFYKRTETNVKQTVRFNSRQTIRLEQFLLRLFYFILFHCIFLTRFYIFYHILAFATFLSILTCFNIFMLI